MDTQQTPSPPPPPPRPLTADEITSLAKLAKKKSKERGIKTASGKRKLMWRP